MKCNQTHWTFSLRNCVLECPKFPVDKTETQLRAYKDWVRFMRNVRFPCMLDPEHEETTAHRKVGDYRPNDKATFPSSSVQCVHHNSTLHIQSSLGTDISIMIGGSHTDAWIQNRTLPSWHLHMASTTACTKQAHFWNKACKNLSCFFIYLNARPINVEFGCIPKVTILFVQWHVCAALRSSRSHLWRPRFGRTYGPVVRQTTEWMNERTNEWLCSHL